MVGSDNSAPSLVRTDVEVTQLIGAEGNPNALSIVVVPRWCTAQRPLKNTHQVITAEEAHEHRDSARRKALYQHPPQILEVFKERLYRPALFLLYWLKRLRFGFIHHDWNPSAASSLRTGRRLGNSLIGFDVRCLG